MCSWHEIDIHGDRYLSSRRQHCLGNHVALKRASQFGKKWFHKILAYRGSSMRPWIIGMSSIPFQPLFLVPSFAHPQRVPPRWSTCLVKIPITAHNLQTREWIPVLAWPYPNSSHAGSPKLGEARDHLGRRIHLGRVRVYVRDARERLYGAIGWCCRLEMAARWRHFHFHSMKSLRILVEGWHGVVTGDWHLLVRRLEVWAGYGFAPSVLRSPVSHQYLC